MYNIEVHISILPLVSKQVSLAICTHCSNDWNSDNGTWCWFRRPHCQKQLFAC